MDALLIELWLRPDDDPVLVIDDASVSLAREAVRARGAAEGMDRSSIERAAIVASELARNQLAHGRGGRLVVRGASRDGVAGLEIVAADRGPGFDEPRVFEDGYSTARSLGIGLSGVRRMAQEVDVDVRVGEGACIWARVFATPIARRPEVAILGKPRAGERVSGDHGGFRRDGDVLTIAVVDGLGHGADARIASDTAMRAAWASHAAGPTGVLAACDAALVGSRGAVMAVVTLEGGALQHGAAGNVTTRIESIDGSRSFGGPGMVLGVPRPGARGPQLERAVLAPRAVVIAFTDGLRQRASLGGDRALFHEPPFALAARLHREFWRDSDDGLVVVVR